MANLSALLGFGGGSSGEEIYPFVDTKSGSVFGLSSFVDILPLTLEKGIIDKFRVTHYSTNTSVYLWLRVTIDGGTPFELVKTLDDASTASKHYDVLLNLKYQTSIRIEARNNGTALARYYQYHLTRRWQ